MHQNVEGPTVSSLRLDFLYKSLWCRFALDDLRRRDSLEQIYANVYSCRLTAPGTARNEDGEEVRKELIVAPVDPTLAAESGTDDGHRRK